MFSAVLKIIIQPVIDFVESLVFSSESSYFPSSLLNLIDSNPEYILSLRDIFAQIIVFHNLILGSPLIMNRFTLILFGHCCDRGNIIL
jgi:hypothetical protein